MTLAHILKKLLHGRTPSTRENPQKVQQKVQELNAMEPRNPFGEIIPQWIGIQDYFAITGFHFNNGHPLFDAKFGFPLKAFLNTKTGEIKVFSASFFEN